MSNKVDIIEPSLSHFDVISLTETWLNGTVPDQDLALSDFHFEEIV